MPYSASICSSRLHHRHAIQNPTHPPAQGKNKTKRLLMCGMRRKTVTLATEGPDIILRLGITNLRQRFLLSLDVILPQDEFGNGVRISLFPRLSTIKGDDPEACSRRIGRPPCNGCWLVFKHIGQRRVLPTLKLISPPLLCCE